MTRGHQALGSLQKQTRWHRWAVGKGGLYVRVYEQEPKWAALDQIILLVCASWKKIQTPVKRKRLAW